MIASEAFPSASDHPPTWKFDYPIVHAETRAQWRTWLAHNHMSTRGVWLCSWRSSTDRPRCPYPEAVEEAICFGWIDSTNTVLDGERGLQLFTPRRPKSQWTRLNRDRAADMDERGLMTDAGRRAITAAKSNGWWTISDQVEDLVEPLELETALDRNPQARSHWDSFPPSARKQMLWWIVSAARDTTRSGRIAQVVADAAAGLRTRG
ncbi:YdeI/OmpD-associated family protein [Rhodococcus sp. 077-4]|uniref:YdeI/OmpD-associated family protein n=1 Tax=Rhodococcus sp. 077-4 TaxID=2789271 RepID=UPI0039F54BB2